MFAHDLHMVLMQERFTDPVIAADGFTYDRRAFIGWAKRGEPLLSPVTGEPMPTAAVLPNYTLRRLLHSTRAS